MKSLLSILSIIIFSFHSFAQEEKKVNTLENQFDEIFRTSTRYSAPDRKIYRVINQDRYLKLKKDVLDSLSNTDDIIASKNNQLLIQEKNIKNLTASADSTKIKLDDAISKEENISLFGLQLKKTNYNIILWSVIALLVVVMIYYLFKYRSSHVHTKDARERLTEVEEELEEFRKKSLTKEQKLRRQLQDEINKQK